MTKNSDTTNPTSVNRRAALRLVPYVKNPTSVALTGPALAALPEHDRLAMLIARYYAEVDVFNATDHPTDAESDALMEKTYMKTVAEMTGVPATTAAGALAALAFIEREEIVIDSDSDSDYAFDAMIMSLLKAVRGYIEHGLKA